MFRKFSLINNTKKYKQLTRLRTTDTAFRQGGEEFAVIFLKSDSGAAAKVCAKLRKKTEQTKFKYQDEILRVTVSIGITSLNSRELTKNQLIAEADKALYHSKESGRNRVTLFQDI